MYEILRKLEGILGFKTPTALQYYVMHISYLYELSDSLSTSH